MLKIRLSRIGKNNDPFYRIVLTEEGDKARGEVVANLGTWYPQKNTKKLNKAEIANWVKKGAQISPTVKKLMV